MHVALYLFTIASYLFTLNTQGSIWTKYELCFHICYSFDGQFCFRKRHFIHCFLYVQDSYEKIVPYSCGPTLPRGSWHEQNLVMVPYWVQLFCTKRFLRRFFKNTNKWLLLNYLPLQKRTVLHLNKYKFPFAGLCNLPSLVETSPDILNKKWKGMTTRTRLTTTTMTTDIWLDKLEKLTWDSDHVS